MTNPIINAQSVSGRRAARLHSMSQAIVACLVLCTTAFADYRVAFVRSARPDDTHKVSFPDVFRPAVHPPSDLCTATIAFDADGKPSIDPASVQVLVSGQGRHALLDPRPSLDGKWLYFAGIQETEQREGKYTPIWGSDIYRVELATGKVVRVTDRRYTPPTGIARWADPNVGISHHVMNLGPCPLPGGRLAFTSTRRGYAPVKGFTTHNCQLFLCDDIPGKTDWNGEAKRNVECTGHLNLGSALHPVLLTTGEIMWASYESQGLRDIRLWSIWRSWPDGRKWGPLFSDFDHETAYHFQGQRSDGSLTGLFYYNLNNNGTGTLLETPLTVDMPEYLSPDGTKNRLPLNPANILPGENRTWKIPTMRRGTYAVTPWITPGDFPNTIVVNGRKRHLGKMTHPSGAPHNHLLVSYSLGPSNDNGIHLPIYQFTLALIRKKTTRGPQDVDVLLADKKFNYTQPVALVPYKAIYGKEPPVIPVTPNPTGTPFGIVGSSSAHIGQWKPRNKHEGKLDNGGHQGFWSGIDVDETGRDKTRVPAGIDIVAFEPDPLPPRGPSRTGGWAAGGTTHHVAVNERLRLLARIRFDEPDRPPGDTSFWCRIPADVPFTFRTFDKSGRTVTFAQTWHQVRPGETRVDCGGCHNHSGREVKWEKSFAATTKPKDFRDTKLRTPEFNRDVLPIFKAKCWECHGPDKNHRVTLTASITGENGLRWLAMGFGKHVKPGMAFASKLSQAIHGERGTKRMPYKKPPLSEEEIRKIDEWIDYFCLISNYNRASGRGAWLDATRPTLYVPRSGEVKIGAFDYFSGLAGPPQATLNGRRLPLSRTGDGVWSAERSLKPGDSLQVAVQDNAGNRADVDRYVRPAPKAPPADKQRPTTDQ